MAIWQWDVWMVPRKEVEKRFDLIPDYLDLDWFESTQWWNTVSECELVAFFSSVLPIYPMPWAEHTRGWGSDNGNRMMLAVEDGKIADVVIRFDLSDFNINFLNSLVNFAEGNDFLFFSLESQKFIESNLADLLKEIKKSRKIVFLQDPEKFFADKKYLDAINKQNRRKINSED